LKLWEINFNVIITHVAGQHNLLSDFFSRVVITTDPVEKGSDFSYRSAQHILPSFNPYTVITKEELLSAFESTVFEPCILPDSCSLNVQNYLYRGVGPFDVTCKNAQQLCKLTSEALRFQIDKQELESHFTSEKILEGQLTD